MKSNEDENEYILEEEGIKEGEEQQKSRKIFNIQSALNLKKYEV